MSYQLLILLGFYIINSSEWDMIFNLNEDDKLLCYSCKGNECEKLTNNDENKILCNKKTQLCWAGFIDQQPYRTCANRFCTPSDISLDSNIHIETCCRSNLCNSVSLSWSAIGKSHKQISSSSHPATIEKHRITDIVGEILYEKSSVLIDKDKSDDEEKEEETAPLSKVQLNATNPDIFGIYWDGLSYDKDFSNRVASISSVLLFLMPLLLVLLL